MRRETQHLREELNRVRNTPVNANSNINVSNPFSMPRGHNDNVQPESVPHNTRYIHNGKIVIGQRPVHLKPNPIEFGIGEQVQLNPQSYSNVKTYAPGVFAKSVHEGNLIPRTDDVQAAALVSERCYIPGFS